MDSLRGEADFHAGIEQYDQGYNETDYGIFLYLSGLPIVCYGDPADGHRDERDRYGDESPYQRDELDCKCRDAAS